MNRLPAATPMASPIANDNPTVTVLLITFLPRARPSDAITPPCPPPLAGEGRVGVFAAVADCSGIVYRKPAALNYSAGSRPCTSTPSWAHGAFFGLTLPVSLPGLTRSRARPTRH